jgi:chromosome transmission fidelity protein 4
MNNVQGKIEYPYFPRPIISNIELQIPLLHMDAETTKLEER